MLSHYDSGGAVGMLSQEESTRKLGLQKQNQVKNVGIFWVTLQKQQLEVKLQISAGKGVGFFWILIPPWNFFASEPVFQVFM